ncbi:MAG: HD domain-containing protein, partial [Deltaproteobacteria bacterium]|nr:HD domain-containing protein [Deltaproteobacteria bacterium]
MIFKRKNNAEKLDLLMLPDYPEVLQPYRISFRLGENKSESAKLYWNECLDQLKKLHQEQVSSEILVKLLSMNIDDLITTLFERADWLFQESHPSKSRKCALIALGGYGRSEMHPHSDVDLLFVYSSKEKPEEYLNAISDAILYVLWDLKLDLGNITRSIQESRLLFKEDVVSVSSMLDARYLAGDKNIAQDFLQMIQEEIQTKSARDFFDQEKSKENRDRRKKFGSSVYIIEPNVKESEGGLRDVQTLLWYAHVFQQKKTLETLLESKWLTEESYQELKVGRNFLWQVRNAIHFHLDQKKDQLTFPLQEKISKELGYEDEPGILAVEKFMQTYYHHAANIKRIIDLSVDEMVHKTEKKLKLIVPKGAESFDSDFVILGEKLLAKDPLCFEKNPFNLMRVFLVAQKENVDLGEETRRLISKNLHLADEDFASHPEVNRMIRDLFTELKGLGRVLNLMHELKMLHRVIPEFGEVLYRPQHDVYHIYTVDNHSIFAVGELSKLFEGTYDNTFSYFKEVLFQTPRHDLLSLGTFFHDVGKGRGKNHSIVGAEMALRATQRMGFSDKDCEMVEFLVKSHLLMPHLSQRRDLD